jgi:hypothetical protein
MRRAIDDIALPKNFELTGETEKMVDEILEPCRRRVEGMA